jgi:VWFA-related protein
LSWSLARVAPSPESDRLTFEDVVRSLSARAVEVYAVSTQTRPTVLSDAWLDANRSTTLLTEQNRRAGVPHYTAYLAELVRLAGGRLYFLRELGTLSDVYARIAKNLRAQYTLGYYPAAGAETQGWRKLGVEVRGRPELRVRHRVGYYNSGR